MKPHHTPFRPTWAALAATALLAACGGGDADPPPGSQDTTAPTLTITDNVSATTASGDVQFTFTFSEAVTGFATDDITVTGGSKGTFTMASDGRSATLVVSPTANSTGTVQVNVAAGSFRDTAENLNASAASASQAFDTTTPPTPPAGTLATFEEATPPTVEVFGGAAGTIDTAPAGGNGKALKITRNGGEPWAGVWVPVPAVPSNAGDQKVTARVYSPVAGVPFVVKLEWGDNQGSGNVQANEAVVVGWQTLTWTIRNLDASKTYNRFVVLPQLETVGSGQVFYVDDVTVDKAPTPETPVGTTLTFSSGFASAVLTSSGGLVASAGGSNLDNWGCNGTPEWCGGFAGGSGADSYAGFYYQTPSTPSAPTGLYSQIEVFGPNVTGFSTTGDTGGVTLNGQTRLNFTFNQNPEWFNRADNRFAVVLTLGKRYAIDGGCRLQLHGVKTPTSVDATAYTMTLASDFRVAADCGTGIAPDNVAAALAASPVVSSVKVMGAGGGAAIVGRNSINSTANLSQANGEGKIPTTVVLKGAITFN